MTCKLFTCSSAQKTYSKRPFIPPKETWTHDLGVLSEMNTEVTPNKEELEKLRQAGLGQRKIVFPNKNAGFKAFSKVLMEKYPKLRDGGGFQLLRALGGGGGVGYLELVIPGQDGYSIPYLRETMFKTSSFVCSAVAGKFANGKTGTIHVAAIYVHFISPLDKPFCAKRHLLCV